jgi:acetyltransferase-like isoleucine patch superfamily enzyme
MKKLLKLLDNCKKSDSSVPLVIVSHLYYKMRQKNIIANNKTIIRGLKNISTKGLLMIGMGYVGFMHKHDRTYLNVNGKLSFKGNFSIGKGCRFDIGNGAAAEFGSGYVNSNTNFIIMHRITVGDDCAIAWGCQFLDEDFHKLHYPSKKEKSSIIEIGNHVWIGSNVTVLKGSRIPDGCVVASGSVISSKFERKNTFIAGNPAKVIKEDIEWH